MCIRDRLHVILEHIHDLLQVVRVPEREGKQHVICLLYTSVSRFLGRHYTVSLLGGVGYMMREETYKDHDYLIRNVLGPEHRPES